MLASKSAGVLRQEPVYTRRYERLGGDVACSGATASGIDDAKAIMASSIAMDQLLQSARFATERL